MALRAAEVIIHYTSQGSRTLAKLAPQLMELGYLKEALTAVRKIRYDDDRAEALVELAPYLPESALLRRKVLAVARKIGEDEHRAKALAGLGAFLPESLLQEALDIARRIRDDEHRAEALAGLIPHLPDAERMQAWQEALTAVWKIRDDAYQAHTLAGLAPHLPRALREEALDLAREILASFDQAVVGLAPYLPKEERIQVLRTALAEAREGHHPYGRDRILIRLTSQLAELGYSRAALDAALAIRTDDDRAKALIELVPHLPEEKRIQTIEAALEAARTSTSDDQVEILLELAPYLSETLLEKALEMVQTLWRREKVLTKLLPRLAEVGKPKQALDVAKDLADGRWRSVALVGLAPHLSEPLLREALDTAWAIEPDDFSYSHTRNPYDRDQALAGLVPRLAELGHPEEAFEIAWRIDWEIPRAQALMGVLPYLPEAERGRALQRAFYDAGTSLPVGSEEQIEALLMLAPHFGRTVLRRALEIAREILDDAERSKMLARLIPHLPDAERTQAVREALHAAHLETTQWFLGGFGSIDDRGEAMVKLVSHLPESFLPEAFGIACNIGPGYPRMGSLATLAPRLAELPPSKLYPLWQRALHTLAARSRQDLLVDVRALEPVINALGGEEAVVETFRAIQDVGRWWP